MNNKEAFTVIEIIIGTIILGILSTLAITNYSVSINRSRARDVMNNLLALHVAQSQFKEINRQYCTSTLDMFTINSSNPHDYCADTAAHISKYLGVNVSTSTDVVGYACSATKCWATFASTLTMELTFASPVNPGTNPLYCSAAACGTSNYSPNPCCDISLGGVACKSCP